MQRACMRKSFHEGSRTARSKPLFPTPITSSSPLPNEYCDSQDHKGGHICSVSPAAAALGSRDIFGLCLLLFTLALFAYAKYWISRKKRTVLVNGKVDCSLREMTVAESEDCGLFPPLCEQLWRRRKSVVGCHRESSGDCRV